MQTTVFAQSFSNFTRKLWMMREGTLLIWGHRVKGQGQLLHSVYKALWAQYRLQFMSNHFQTSHVGYGWWGENPIDFGSRGHRSRSTLPPARGCHALRCLVNYGFLHMVANGELCCLSDNTGSVLIIYDQTNIVSYAFLCPHMEWLEAYCFCPVCLFVINF